MSPSPAGARDSATPLPGSLAAPDHDVETPTHDLAGPVPGPELRVDATPAVAVSWSLEVVVRAIAIVGSSRPTISADEGEMGRAEP